MITINNRCLCRYCFEKLEPHTASNHYCTHHHNIEKYRSALPEGEVLCGRYIVGKVLGQGGFGITYLCYDTATDSRVAIKEYFPAHCTYRNYGEKNLRVNSEPEAFKKGLKKYRAEANLLSTLRGYKGVVEVMSYFSENNTEYFVMEYLSGKDFKTLKRENPFMEEAYVIHLMMEILKTLSVIHYKNILHRDISPNNIFLCNDGIIKLIDFGASRVAEAGASNTLSIILNPGFAPPEQYRKKGKQGPWTDIYALGATMYFMLKCKLPEPAASRLVKDVLDLSGISPGLAFILTKMLSLRIETRYKNAGEVINDLIALQSNKVVNDSRIKANIGNVNKHSPLGYVSGSQSEIVDNYGNRIDINNNGPVKLYSSNVNHKHTNKKNTVLAVCCVCIAIAIITAITGILVFSL